MTGHRLLRIAVIGLGWAGCERHLPWLRRHHAVALVGVVDRNHERVAAAQRRFRVPRGSDVADGRPSWLDQVDAVTLATPPATHFNLARSLLQAGKHVLVEKPLAMTPEEAATLHDLAQREARVLAVVHNFQFARALRRLRRLLASGQLGDLWGIEGTQLSSPSRRLPAWYESLPWGLFYDESPHLLYLAASLVPGPLRLQHAHQMPSPSGRNTPALVSATFEGGGLPVRISMNFESSISEWQLIVIGSRRLALADLFRDILITVPNDGQHRGRNVLRSTAHLVAGHLLGTFTSGIRLWSGRLAYGNDEVQRRFIQAIHTGQPPAGISAADGLAVVQLQHAIMNRADGA